MDFDYKFVDNLLAELPQIPPDSIISRTIYADDQIKIILFGFAPGQELSEHTASKAAILHFLKGEGTLSLGADSYAVKSGSWLHMPPKLPHSVLAENELFMLLTLLEG